MEDISGYADGLTDARNAAYQRLAAVVRDWRAAGRKTTTAGVKSALLKSEEGFDEASLGFRSFSAFLEAADAAGFVGRIRQPNGHWLVSLPGESADELGLADAPDVGGANHQHRIVADDTRLRPDVWASFVDWRPHHRRLWDTEQQRALLYPVDADGRPAWETAPSRFIEIQLLDQDIQRDWMRQFAESCAESERVALVAALEAASELGSFRRALERFDLQGRWRSELQRRVAAEVSRWAHDNGIPESDLVSLRQAPRESERGPKARGSGAAAMVRRPLSSRTGDGDLERLRTRLHAIIDLMSLADLAALPVRAEYLLPE